MSEIERLRAYHPFDEDVLETVSKLAEVQRRCSWNSIARALPDKTIYAPDNSSPIEVLDIVQGDYESTQVYHLPFGYGLDASMTMRLATLAAAQPSTRLIAISGPGGIGRGKGRLPMKDCQALAKGNMRPVVEPLFRYLNSQKLSNVVQLGYSSGADKAAMATFYAEHYDQSVPKGIFMEPVSVTPRSLIDLALAFKVGAKGRSDYAKATNCPAYFEARKLAKEQKKAYGLPVHALNLLRISNLAIANSLTYPVFWPYLSGALDQNSNLKTDLVWGSQSSVSRDKSIKHQLKKTNRLYPNLNRVRTMVIDGAMHAMSEDIYLLSAMVLQSVKD